MQTVPFLFFLFPFLFLSFFKKKVKLFSHLPLLLHLWKSLSFSHPAQGVQYSLIKLLQTLGFLWCCLDSSRFCKQLKQATTTKWREEPLPNSFRKEREREKRVTHLVAKQRLPQSFY